MVRTENEARVASKASQEKTGSLDPLARMESPVLKDLRASRGLPVNAVRRENAALRDLLGKTD